MNGYFIDFLHQQVTKQVTWELKSTCSPQKQNKTKKRSKLARWKNPPFHDALDHFVFLYISTACLRQRLPYILKDDCSEWLWNSLTNEGLILDQWKITPLCCCGPFSTFTWILSEEVLYCHLYCNSKYYHSSSEVYVEPCEISIIELFWENR